MKLDSVYRSLLLFKGNNNLFYNLRYYKKEQFIYVYTEFVDCVNDCIELDISINKRVAIVTDGKYTKFNFDCYGLTNQDFNKVFHQNYHYDSITIHKNTITNKYTGLQSIIDILTVILGMYGGLEMLTNNS